MGRIMCHLPLDMVSSAYGPICPKGVYVPHAGPPRKKVVFYDVPKRGDPVLPIDFFAFRIGASVVQNRHFANTDILNRETLAVISGSNPKRFSHSFIF